MSEDYTLDCGSVKCACGCMQEAFEFDLPTQSTEKQTELNIE